MHPLYSLPICFAILFMKGRRHFLKSCRRFIPFICVYTPNCHRFFLDFLQFLCISRHYLLIPICFICYYGELSDFAVFKTSPCITGSFPPNLRILRMMCPELTYFYMFTNCFIFIQTRVIVPGYTKAIKRIQQGSRRSMCFI